MRVTGMRPRLENDSSELHMTLFGTLDGDLDMIIYCKITFVWPCEDTCGAAVEFAVATTIAQVDYSNPNT